MPNPLRSASSPTAARTPEAETDQRRHQAEMAASTRTERNTWRRLAPTIRSRASSRVRWPDDDRERVEDGEAAHEQGDEGEDQQGGGEERQRLVDGVRLLVGHGLAGDHLDPGREDGGDGPLERRPCPPPAVATTSMASKLADLAEQLLGRGQVEGGQRGPGQVVGRAELDDAGDGEGLGRPGQEDAHVVAHAEVVLLCRARSMTTSWRRGRARCPPTRWSDESCGLGSKEMPMVGAPPVVMALPSGATNWA